MNRIAEDTRLKTALQRIEMMREKPAGTETPLRLSAIEALVHFQTGDALLDFHENISY